MFSYRHAFHAGNHADVLKHTVLIAILKHLIDKDSVMTLLDTHAGAGLYRLDGDYADTSGEAADGIMRLTGLLSPTKLPKDLTDKLGPDGLAPALKNYLEMVASFNTPGSHKVYPGSPFIIQNLMAGRDRDKLKLFELHPTDAKTLSANVAQLEAGRQVAVLREDGFEGIKKFLPPPTPRALLFCDPSYELKDDYDRVPVMVADAVKRFAVGTYVVWYPIIPRPQAHDLPRKLKTLATKAGKGWLNATLTVKSSKLLTDAEGQTQRPGLPASGMFVINPPHTLKAALQLALPQMAKLLAQDRNAAFTVDAGG